MNQAHLEVIELGERAAWNLQHRQRDMRWWAGVWARVSDVRAVASLLRRSEGKSGH